MPKTYKPLTEDVEASYAHSGANGFKPELNSDEEEESRTVLVQIYADAHADGGSKVKKEEDNGIKEGKAKDRQKTGLSERRSTKKSTLMPPLQTIDVGNENPEVTICKRGLQNGFIYFNGFAINNWIIIYLIRKNLSNKLIRDHMTTMVTTAQYRGIPLGMPSNHYVLSLKSNGNKVAQETKEEIVQVLTTSSLEKVQMAMIIAPNNIDLEELTDELTPMYNFRILTGYFTANYNTNAIQKSLRSFCQKHKKLSVMGIASRIHDGHVMIARCRNEPYTGATFDTPSFRRCERTIVPDNQFDEQVVSIVSECIKIRSSQKQVIYRSHDSSICQTMSYQNEVSNIQKLLKASRTRFTYVVATQNVSGSNQPIFEKVVDGIGFTDEEMTQLTEEVSFDSQKKWFPAVLAMARMSIARMVVHYDGFKESENYEQVVRVRKGLDTKAYETVKKFLKSSLSDTEAETKIKSRKMECEAKISSQQNADRMMNMNQGLNQKTNKVVCKDVETIFDDSGANSYQREMNSDEEQESRTAYVLKYADDVPNVKEKEDNGSKEDPGIAIYKRGLQKGFVYFNGFAINNWIIIYLVREGLSDNFIHNHLTTMMDKAKLDKIPLGIPSKRYVFSLKSNGKKVAQETKEEIVQILTTSSQSKLQLAVIYATTDIDLKELQREITPRFNFRIITGYFIPNKCGPIGILTSLRSFVKEHKELPVMGIATRIHDAQLMIARTFNNFNAGATFDRRGFRDFELTIVPENQSNEQLVSIVWNYIKNRSLEKLVIYRSHESSICGSVSHQIEVYDIQKLMEWSGTRITYIVVKEIASGSNQPIFEKLVDDIGFTNEEMTQLTTEVSLHSLIKRIPAPLAMAQMYTARMMVHYYGFKHLENYEQVAQVKKGFDKEAYNAVKKYLKSSW